MLVLALADRRPYPKLDKWLEKYPRIEMIISLGDLEGDDLWPIKNLRIPKLGVYGNHCWNYMEDPDYDLGIINMHMKMYTYKQMKMIGLEGSPRYREGPHQFTQAEIKNLISDWPYADIVLTHTPPFGLGDNANISHDQRHHGWHALKNYIEIKSPRFVLHGHTHPRTMQTHYQDTLIHWVSGAQVLDLKDRHIEVIEAQHYVLSPL